jgi:hypothetical protein
MPLSQTLPTHRDLLRRLSLVTALGAALGFGMLAFASSSESAGGGPGTMFSPQSGSTVYAATDSAGGGPGTM